MKSFKYIIVGNSAAGVCAAEAIREYDKKGSIAMISDEPYHTYSRALIGHFLAGQIADGKMRFRPEDFYERFGITPLLGCRVTSVDTKKRQVVIEGSESFSYGSLLLATGGKPFVPPLGGIGLKGITTFISLDDAKRLDSLIGDAKNVVVIGGGFIGMQAAEALKHRGMNVTVVELLNRILGLVLDETASRIVEKVFSANGVNIVTGQSVTDILPDEANASKVGGVRLSSGETIPADVVVIAIGVVPRLELAQSAKLKTRRGIVVDSHMRTSAPDVYSAGDAAEVMDFLLGVERNIPIWPSATYGGRVAGANMAGQDVGFSGITGMNAADFFGFPIISAGIVNPKPEDGLEVILKHFPQRNYVAKIFVDKSDRIRGMVFCGDAVDRSGMYYGLMRDGVAIGDFRDSLLDESFDFFAARAALGRARNV